MIHNEQNLYDDMVTDEPFVILHLPMDVVEQLTEEEYSRYLAGTLTFDL